MEIKCDYCDGDGKVNIKVFGNPENEEEAPCPICEGNGTVDDGTYAEPEPIPLCDNILSAYDPERGERLTGVSLTDFRLAEAITQLESMVHRQAHEIKLLQAQLAEIIK